MTQDASMMALIFDKNKLPQAAHLSFFDFSSVMSERLKNIINTYLQSPLDTINRLQHEAPQPSGVVEAYLDIFKSRQAQSEKLSRVFSVVKFSPTLFGVVCDMDEALGFKAPNTEFYQSKFLHDFSPLEAEHFDWSESVSEIYQNIKTSFLEDNIRYLEQHSDFSLAPEKKMWCDVAKSMTTIYSATGIDGVIENYDDLNRKIPMPSIYRGSAKV